MRTCKTIIQYFKEQSAQKQPIAHNEWMEGALLVNTLIGDEYEKLIELESDCSKMYIKYIDSGDTNATARERIKAVDTYKQMQTQKMFVKQCEEFVRLAKKSADLARNEMYK